MGKPSLHVGDQWRRPFLSFSKANLRIKAAQFGLDAIQLSDPFDAVFGNRC